MLFLSASTNIRLYIALFLCICTGHINAQQSDFSFSELSSTQYKEKITQLEKYKAPVKYTEKSAQAWYSEILTDRNKSLLSYFKGDKIIHDTLLLNKCNAIFSRIKNANKNYRFDSIQLYINRSTIPNAACFGEGTIMINAGLLLWIDNDDELALVIGHEIAHQVLNHLETQTEKTIAMLTSDEFKEELKKIKKENYGKFSRFRNLMKGLNIESSNHSTYKESEADSLGVVLIKNANYNVTAAAKILLKLDNVDELYKSKKLYSLKECFEKSGIDMSYFNVKPKYNGLSSINVEMNADEDLDSLKTHPDCVKRYEAVVGNSSKPDINCCSSLNNTYTIYKERAMFEMVRYLYEKNSLGWCTHLLLFALKNNYNPTIYNYFLADCFSKIYYSDKRLERFNTVNAEAERESNIKETQDFLFAVSNADLEKLAAHFLYLNVNVDSEDYQFADLRYNTQVKMKDTATYNIKFLNQFPKSKYQYLIQKK